MKVDQIEYRIPHRSCLSASVSGRYGPPVVGVE